MVSLKANIKKWWQDSSLGQKILPLKQANYLNQMPLDELRRLIQTCESHHFLKTTPNIQGKNLLLLSNQHTQFLVEPIIKLEPKLLINYQVDTGNSIPKEKVLNVKGGLNPLALKSNRFEVVYLPFASEYQTDLTYCLNEIKRITTHKARVIISIMHPQCQWMLTKQNPNHKNYPQFNLNHYLNLFRQSDFYLEAMEEIVVDEKVKPFFTSSQLLSTESEYYQEFEGFPLVSVFRLVQYNQAAASEDQTKVNHAPQPQIDPHNQQYLRKIYGF